MDYKEINAVNWSTLKELWISPKQYRHRVTTPRPDTEALITGRAVHCAVYEPERFQTGYVVYPGPVRRGRAWEEFCEEHAGDEIVTENQRRQAEMIAMALQSDPIARSYINGGFCEQAFMWTDPDTLLDCKGRVDQVNGRLIELKTTTNIIPRKFIADAARFGYHGQIAFYADGLAANGIQLDGAPILIAVQSDEPFDVVCYHVTEDVLNAGRRLYQELLRTLLRCRETDIWPGVAGGGILPMTVPAWASPEEPEHELTIGGAPVGAF